ncbi:hypothetical protein DAI22_03g251200 [Oryza sativa Japonica Group]|nr:hypothetical protein DAI22_03g251200 [Oryza sativa Japonica Group]
MKRLSSSRLDIYRSNANQRSQSSSLQRTKRKNSKILPNKTNKILFVSMPLKVYELHRLYRVQKQLMSDLNRSPPELTCRRRQRRKQHTRRRALNLQLPADEYIVVADAGGQATPLPPPPPSSREDELALTLAVGGGGAAGRRNNKRRESSPFTSNCSGGSLTTATSTSTSSSTDSDGSLRQPPPCPRAMAFDVLHDGSTAAAAAAAPWLQQRLSLRMA